MKALAALHLALVVLILSWNCGQLAAEDRTTATLESLGESEDFGQRNLLGFPVEDYFNSNDTPCVIIDGGSLPLEHCHENVEKPIPITLRAVWDSMAELETLESPAEFVVIKDGGRQCNSAVECMSRIQSMRKRAQVKGCDLRENFYIGGDGNVYEGRGWDHASYWYLDGFRHKSITVQFLGSHERTPPSLEAVEAFETIMEFGLWQRKLSKNYSVTSIRQLLQDSTLSEDLLSQNPSRSDRWLSGEELSSLWEYAKPSHLRFVFRRHWSAEKPTKEFDVLSQPVDYVVISETGDRCFNRTECSSKMKAMQAEYMENYGDLLDNFYIGDEGEVYEGRGWHYAPHWHIKGYTNRYLSVRFFGTFASDPPSRDAINALKLLVQTGVWVGKISPDHRMFSLRQVYDQSVLLGDSLHEYVKKWSIWSKDVSFISTSPPAGLWPLASRSDWNAASPTISFPRTSQPIKYIMIADGGIRCFTNQLCSSIVKAVQRNYVRQYGDLLDNFYVGDDGIVYEGRGWNVLPFLHTPFFNRSLITVNFIGSFKSSLPSQPGWLAFLALLNAGIATGNISPEYKLYSFRHVYNDSSLLGDKISRLLEEMNAWDGQLSLVSEDQRELLGILPIYKLDSSASTKELPPLNLPVDYVVVGDIGDRCFTQESCREDLQRRQTTETKSFGGLTYNFYVGEDGSVFTGRGWHSTCYWHVKGVKANTLFIAFSGKFQDDLPSSYATLAFNRLLKFGVGSRKLATDYKIISIRQLFPNSTHAGRRLADKIKTWSQWSEYEAVSPGGTSIPFGPTAFVWKSQWSAKSVAEVTSEELTHPISHVIILDGEASCFNLDDCILRVQAEQRRVHPQYGDAMENFYIGEDGRIYEGRGWSQKTHWHSRILLFDYVTVAFLGKFQGQLPSSNAVTAFEYWTKVGIMGGKLTANYTVVSLRQFISNGQTPGDALDKHVRTWENWLRNTSQAFITDNFEINSPRVWGSSTSIRRSNKIIHPILYVFVREGGLPCSSQSECISRMKAAEKETNAITENFYIGGNGAVFEGVGWEYDTKWGFNGWKNSLTVSFLGTFGSTQLPSPRALVAFEVLCQYGVKRGYIVSNYKILYIPDNYNSKIWVGTKFKELMKTWKHWSANI